VIKLKKIVSLGKFDMLVEGIKKIIKNEKDNNSHFDFGFTNWYYLFIIYDINV
jgi:hypothetical protein